jgi:hypothetical protein
MSNFPNGSFAPQAADQKRRFGENKGQDGFDAMVFGSL